MELTNTVDDDVHGVIAVNDVEHVMRCATLACSE